MTRWVWLALLPLAACASAPAERTPAANGYAGTVQKVFRIVRQGEALPFMRFLGKAGSALAPALRNNGETLQYVVRTPSGQVLAQTDEEFEVGDCVEVVPQVDRSGPAFGYGEAIVVRSGRCNG